MAIIKYSIIKVTEISTASSKTKSPATLNIIANKNKMERMGSRAVIERVAKTTIIDATRKNVIAWVILNSPEPGTPK